jgi:3-phosphoshikimate 1-carboxyvinyltransferase
LEIDIEKSTIQGKIQAPQSKSFAIRIAFLSLLTEVNTNFWTSDDIITAINAVKAIKRGDSYIYVGGSATTLRILIPIVVALKRKVTIDGDETLRKRPINAIIKALKKTSFSSNFLPVTIYGELERETTIEGWESSQYITGLIYAYHILGEGIIHIIPPISSLSYISMTIDLLNSLGSRIQMKDNVIYIKSSRLSSYNSKIPGDYLLSSFYAIASLITGGKIEIDNLYAPQDYFGDHSIVEILNRMGAKSYYNGKWIVESSKEYYPIEIDLNASPDMATSISALAAVSKGTSILKNIDRLKIKESDRIKTIIETLNAFKIKASYSNGNILIFGSTPSRGKIICPNDHRIAMLAADLATYSGGAVLNAECVNKSNPAFWEDLKLLGGKISIK